jgi:glycosyltransferase involved in cell wall biosynthesis
MKVALVYDLIYPYSKGGVEKRISDLARLLSARGHETHIFGTKLWDGTPDRVVDGVSFHGICEPVDTHGRGGRRSVWQAARFAMVAAGAIARDDFDVVEVQAMTPLTCLAILVRCRFTMMHPVVIWYEVWREYWNEYLGALGYIGRLVEWLVSRLAPVNAAVSRTTGSRLRAWGVNDVSLLPIGIDYLGIQSVAPDALVSEIIYVGRLARHKNLELLIDAVALLKAEGMTPRVLIVGEGPEREVLERRAESKDLDNLRFLGRLELDDQVVSLMKSARLFAFPSLREGFGLAPLEAGASGLPVVAVRHPDNATCELIEDGFNGLVTSSDPRDFANALKTLLSDAGIRDAMGQRAKDAAEAYDWTHVVSAVEHLYMEAAVRRPRHAPAPPGRRPE